MTNGFTLKLDFSNLTNTIYVYHKGEIFGIITDREALYNLMGKEYKEVKK